MPEQEQALEVEGVATPYVLESLLDLLIEVRWLSSRLRTHRENSSSGCKEQ